MRACVCVRELLSVGCCSCCAAANATFFYTTRSTASTKGYTGTYIFFVLLIVIQLATTTHTITTCCVLACCELRLATVSTASTGIYRCLLPVLSCLFFIPGFPIIFHVECCFPEMCDAVTYASDTEKPTGTSTNRTHNNGMSCCCMSGQLCDTTSQQYYSSTRI
jgi:hypothetical protein